MSKRLQLTLAVVAIAALVGVGRLTTVSPKKRGDFVNSNGFVQGARAPIAGPGITVNGQTVSINDQYAQRRVSSTCSAGNSIQSIAQDGSISCIAAGAGTVSTVSGGTGVTVTNPSTTPNIALDNTVWQSRVTGTAAAHAAITAIAAAGTVTTASFFDTAGTGLASSGAGDIHVNIVGGTCTAGQSVTAVSATGTTTCATVTSGDYNGKVIEWSDEWLGESSVNTGYWTLVPVGTGAVVANTTDPGGVRIGIQTFSTGTTTTGREGVRGGGLNGILLGNGTWVIDWIVGVETLSNSTDGYSLIAGMADTSSAVDQADGCYFLYDERQSAAAPTTGSRAAAASNILNCVCASNSVRTEYPMDGTTVSDASFTTVNAPVGAVTWPSTNVLDLEMQINAAATEVDFFVNGVKSCVITTHIPTGAGRQTNMFLNVLKNVGTTARLVDVDYFHAKDTLASARTP